MALSSRPPGKQEEQNIHSTESIAPQYVTSDPVSDSLTPPDVLLCIFIHGFKGTDLTFLNFPARLQHILSETLDNVKVECIVFPAYETKGKLNEAVVRLADWLTTLTVEREVANGAGGGAGKAKVVLCGHSMGGLLAADCLLEFINTRPDRLAPLWPNIIACIAFDTPYLGLHPQVFANSATKASQYIQTAHKAASGLFSTFSSVTSSASSASSNKAPLAILPAPSSSAVASASAGGWSKWAPAAYAVGGALLAGAAAGTAYYKKQELATGVGTVAKGMGSGYVAMLDHMKYVGNLWDEKAMWERLEGLARAEEDLGVVFKTFFTALPPSPPSYPGRRTFIVLPPAPQKRPPVPRATSTTSVPPHSDPTGSVATTSHSITTEPSPPSPSPLSDLRSKSQPQSRTSSPAPTPPEPGSQPVPPTAPSMSALTRHSHDFRANFIEQRNGSAPDEVQAHMGMFEAATNDGYYEMGLKVAQVVREALDAWKKRQVEEHVIDKTEEQGPDDKSPQMSDDKNSQQVEAEVQSGLHTDPLAGEGDLISFGDNDSTSNDLREQGQPRDADDLYFNPFR